MHCTYWIPSDDDRPTGYDTPDDDDTTDTVGFDISNREQNADEDNLVAQFIRNTYLPSPYDSRKTSQAKYVYRSITLLCVAIGGVFAAVWLLFPGKFVSYRGDTDFNSRYSSSYVDADSLLQQEFSSSGEWQRLLKEDFCTYIHTHPTVHVHFTFYLCSRYKITIEILTRR